MKLDKITQEIMNVKQYSSSQLYQHQLSDTNKINIETRRSTTPEKRVILVQGPC